MRRWLADLLKWPTWLLVLTNTVGLWACAARLWQGSEAQSILATPALRIAAPTPLHDSNRTAVDLSGIQSAALFHESRSFYVPPVVPQVQAPPDYKLSGTLVIPNQPTMAMLIQGRSGARIKVRAGDDLEGWTIESIQAQAVLLRHAEQQFEIRSAQHAQTLGMRPVPLTPETRPVGTGIKLLGSPLAPTRKP